MEFMYDYLTFNDSLLGDNYTYLFYNDSSPDSGGNGVRIFDDWTENLWVRILIIIAFSIVIVVGTVGNLVVLITGCKRRRRTAVYTVFIVNLALCDLYRVLVDAPLIKLVLINLSISDDLRNVSETICGIGTYVTLVFGSCSVWTMLAISVERYVAICHPFKYQRYCTINRARLVVILTWILCAVSLFPLVAMMVNNINIIRVAHDHESAENGEVRTICIYVMETKRLAGDLYYAYLFLFFTGVPLTCIIIAYGKSFYSLHRSMEYFAKTHATQKQVDKRKKIAKMMLCILIVFVVCWVPYITFTAFAAFGGNMQRDNILFVYAVVTWLIFLGSAINPYIYSYYSRDFRYNLNRVMCCCQQDTKIGRFLSHKVCCCCFGGKDDDSYKRSQSTRTDTSEFGSSSDSATKRSKNSEENSSFFRKIVRCASNDDNDKEKSGHEILQNELDSSTPMMSQSSETNVQKRDYESTV
ncbi:adenosine receptor A2b-like [Ptychodera flava]|uniref:adenosine receptor A2b-like n=1 Tax=Ptychodera flava TaxID=63121 RepID=UPI003969E052